MEKETKFASQVLFDSHLNLLRNCKIHYVSTVVRLKKKIDKDGIYLANHSRGQHKLIIVNPYNWYRHGIITWVVVFFQQTGTNLSQGIYCLECKFFIYFLVRLIT